MPYLCRHPRTTDGWFLELTTPLNIAILLVVSGAISIALYTFGVFSPGDSKLFCGVCLILPSWWFGPIQELLRFPTIVLAFNIIMPYTIVAIGYLIVKLVKVRGTGTMLIQLIKASLNRDAVLGKLFGLLQFILIGVGLTYLFESIGWQLDPVMQLILVLAIFGGVQKVLGPFLETPTAFVIPGKQHVGNPKKTNIRLAAETSLCLECHDTKHSPGFTEVVALHTKDVDHSREPMNLEELLASRVSRMGKPTLELFVMSYCPYGVQAEEKLIPIVKEFGDTIDFKLQFIADEKESISLKDITPFTSLHGYPEVAENIRQLLIAKEYPDKYLDYILCRGKKLNQSWEACAQKLDINVEKIQTLFDSPKAEQLFRENIKRAAELGIRASPTILVDNHQFRANHLLRASGTPCQ